MSATRPIRDILSMGFGLQSTVLGYMALEGEMESPDAAIHADTKVEPKAVYAHRTVAEPMFPFPTYIVSAGNLGESELQIRRSKKSGKLYLKNSIPAFVSKPDGGRGILGRKCTADFKIRPIQAKIRELIGKKRLKEWRSKWAVELQIYKDYLAEAKKVREQNAERKKLNQGSKPLPEPFFPFDEWKLMQDDALVRVWIGITTDEADRMKASREPYLRNVWPLIDKNMSRTDCEDWIRAHGFPMPPRSACIFCPFHSDKEWLNLKNNSPEEFAAAMEFERQLIELSKQQEVLKGTPYLHESCVPLGLAKFDDRPSHVQLNLFRNECEGLCGT